MFFNKRKTYTIDLAFLERKASTAAVGTVFRDINYNTIQLRIFQNEGTILKKSIGVQRSRWGIGLVPTLLIRCRFEFFADTTICIHNVCEVKKCNMLRGKKVKEKRKCKDEPTFFVIPGKCIYWKIEHFVYVCLSFVFHFIFIYSPNNFDSPFRN